MVWIYVIFLSKQAENNALYKLFILLVIFVHFKNSRQLLRNPLFFNLLQSQIVAISIKNNLM